MRRVIDILMMVLLTSGLAVGLMFYGRQRGRVAAIEHTREALQELHEQALYRGALEEAERNLHRVKPVAIDAPQLYPVLIDPRWFPPQGAPVNLLADPQRLWLDVAPPDDANDHPPDPVLNRPGQAQFWYNPRRGIFRARVAPQANEAETLALYNQVNSVALPHLPDDADPTREPLAQAEISRQLAKQEASPPLRTNATTPRTPQPNNEASNERPRPRSLADLSTSGG